jgi:hydrogenase/urease accessory protein HupE
VSIPSLALVLATAGAHTAGAHPESLSRTRIRVAGAEVEVEIRFQALSLIEVRPELDPSRDGFLDEGELAAARAEVEAYLLASLRLSSVEGKGEVPLAGRLVSYAPEDPAQLGALELQNVTVRLAFEGSRPLESMVVESRLFHETNPWHKDFCSLTWNDDEPVPHAFEGAEVRWVFEPAHVRRPGVLATFVHLGITHILGTLEHPLAGSDHLAFLLALLVASRRVRTLIGVVTAFTLAHSLTLAAAALGWVHVPSRFVELAIALSIAYVACDNLLRKTARNPWLEAFFFGLLHGLGFAGFLSDALTGEPLILTALLGFNVGVELGQLAFVLACVLVAALLFRAHRREGGAGIVPPRARSAVSVLVAACGFYWFLERAGWLPWG